MEQRLGAMPIRDQVVEIDGL
jgi:hypothetical protein